MNINVNVEELIRILNKLGAYKNNENSNFSKMIDLFSGISNCYNGSLNNEIKTINDLIYMNFKTISQNHEIDTNYISMNITSYKEAEIFTKNKFEQIGELK